MTLPRAITRRDLFMKVGVLLNGIVGVVLAVPIVRYLLSPMARRRRTGYDSWIALGRLCCTEKESSTVTDNPPTPVA
jgi:menaquinol-cytochrome c reductase iron-sulfur subunit